MADVLILPFDGSNGSTTITDASASPKTVTAYGNAQISTAQSKYGGSSLYLDGTGDYLGLGTPADISDLNIGGGDFTIECWVRPSGTGVYFVVGNLNDTDGNGHFWVILNSTYTGLHTVQFGIQGTTFKFGSSALTANTWAHIALSRSGTSLRCFVDGTQLGATETLNNFTGTTNTGLRIGAALAGAYYYFDGYIDDLRITKGEARYTGSFTPPGPITGNASTANGAVCAITHTLFPGNPVVLSLVYAGYKYGADKTTWSFSCDDPVGSTWTTEDTGNPLFGNEGAMYLTYGTTYSSSVKKFGDTSLFFPGGAYLTLPTGALTVEAFADCTFECWINVAASYAPQPAALIYGGGLNVGADPTVMIAGDVFLNRIGQSPAIDLGTWYHYAVCRKANIIRHYLNGNKFAEALSTGALNVTQLGHGHGPTAYYLDSIGFSNNYAHYDANDFQPSLTPFYFPPSSSGALMQVSCTFIPGEATGTRITPTEADTQWNKTVLLLGGGGNVGSKVIADAKGRTIYNQSDVVYSDAHKKFAQTSLYFNGASKLVIPPARNLDFIDGNFTIELWIYPTRIQASALYAKWDGARTRSYILQLDADGKISFTFYDGPTDSNTAVVSLGAVPVNEFSFVSVCKNSNDYRVWVNGIGGAVVTTTKTPYRYSARQYNDVTTWDTDIVVGASGADTASPGEYFQGYIEDFRVTNGFARYTDELYAPPTTSFLKAGSGGEGDPYWNDVKLLVHLDEPNGTTLNIRDARGHSLFAYNGASVTSGGLYGGALGVGTTGYLRTAYDSDFDLSTGDFTFEVWCGGGPKSGFLAGNSYGQNNRGWQIKSSALPTDPGNERAGGIIQWTQWDSNGVQDIAISPLFGFYWDAAYGGPKPRWHHVCVQRRGNDITIFVDGVGATTTITRRPAAITSDIYLGGYPVVNPATGFYVYDEFRLTKAARCVGNTMPIPTGKYPEQAFSFGAALLSSYYALIPGQVKAASVVSGATIPTGYSVIPPLIIGKPTAEGPVISHGLSILAADATGGEGFPEDVAFIDSIITTQRLGKSQLFHVYDEAIAQAIKGVTNRLGVTDEVRAYISASTVTERIGIADEVPPVTMATQTTESIGFHGSQAKAVCSTVLNVAIGVASSAKHAVAAKIFQAMALAEDAITTQNIKLSDSFAIENPAYPAWHETQIDAFSVIDDPKAKFGLPISVTDGFAIDSPIVGNLILHVTIGEDVELHDDSTQNILFSVIMQEHIGLRMFFLSSAYTAWAMNTRNAAVTQYSGFNFNSFARVGERYLGANDQGLYWLDGDDDDGRTVKSRITTGIIQPNGNKLSGVQYAYLGMRGDGQFVVTVTDEAGGSYNYTLTGSSMETARVAFGRGFKTRYFTFSLESQGQDFDLDTVEFITSEISRKVQR